MAGKVITLEDLRAANATLDPSVFSSEILGRNVFAKRVEDVRWANCSRNRYTKDLDQLAEFVDLIEAMKNLLAEEERDLACLPTLELLRVFESAIKEDKSFVVRRFADAMDEYKNGFTSRTDEEQAIIHVLRACRILYLQNRGGIFLKKDLKAKTQLLWARTLCRARGMGGSVIPDKDPRIQDQLGTLPVMNWARLYRKVALKGVKDGKRARKRPSDKD